MTIGQVISEIRWQKEIKKKKGTPGAKHTGRWPAGNHSKN